MILTNNQYTLNVVTVKLPAVGETLRLYGEDGQFIGIAATEYYANGDGAYVLRRTGSHQYSEVSGQPRLVYNVV